LLFQFYSETAEDGFVPGEEEEEEAAEDEEEEDAAARPLGEEDGDPLLQMEASEDNGYVPLVKRPIYQLVQTNPRSFMESSV
jgi:hypothetical protein